MKFSCYNFANRAQESAKDSLAFGKGSPQKSREDTARNLSQGGKGQGGSKKDLSCCNM